MYIIIIVIFLCISCKQHNNPIPNLRIGLTNSIVKIFPNAPVDNLPHKLILKTAIGEYESCQLVVSSDRDISDLSIKTCETNDNIEIRAVNYVNVSRPTDKLGRKGKWPDPLAPLPENYKFSLKKDLNYVFYITVNAMRTNLEVNTFPKKYSIGVKDPSGRISVVEIEHRLRKFAIPERSTMRTAFGIGNSSDAMKKWYPSFSENQRTLYEKLSADISKYRISSTSVNNEHLYSFRWKYDKKNENAIFDFEDFDKQVKQLLALNKWNGLKVGRSFGGWNKLGVIRDSYGFKAKIDSPEGLNALASYAKELEKHLEKQGWLDVAYIYLVDEPFGGIYPSLLKMTSVIKKAAPKLKILITMKPEKGFYGKVDIWVPQINVFPNKKYRTMLEERRKSGDKIWFYVCCLPRAPWPNLFVDHPATDPRVLMWIAFRDNITGFLYWIPTGG